MRKTQAIKHNMFNGLGLPHKTYYVKLWSNIVQIANLFLTYILSTTLMSLILGSICNFLTQINEMKNE